MSSTSKWKSSPLGKIPADWNVEKGDILAEKITKGASPNWQGFSYVNEGVLFVTSENVRDGFLDVSAPKFVEAAFNEKQKNSRLKKGDILINLVGASIGRSCRFDTTLQYPANINQAVCLFRPNGTANADYLKHFLQAPTTIVRLVGSQADGARPNVSLSDIRTFQFLLPPLPEQHKIVAILSEWDRAIELTEKLIAAKQKRKQALMQQLFTGKLRLPGFGKSKWRKCHLDDVASNSTRRNGVPTDVRTVYSVTNSVGMVPMDEGVIGESIDRYKTVSRFDFAYNPMRINVGSIAMWEGAEEVLVSPDYVVFHCGPKLDAQYLNHFRRTHFWRQFVTRAGGGSVRVRIYFSDLGSMKLNLPSIEEQKAIANLLNTQDSEIALHNKKLDALKEQKKGLMQKLLTGKIRVKELVHHV